MATDSWRRHLPTRHGGHSLTLLVAWIAAVGVACGPELATAPDRVGSHQLALSNCQRCFGANGSQCGERDFPGPNIGDWPIGNLIDGLSTCKDGHCWITIGSWLHDTCCYEHPSGYMCNGNIKPTGTCTVEWDLAVGLALNGFNWRRSGIDFSHCADHVDTDVYCAPDYAALHPGSGISDKDPVVGTRLGQYCCSQRAATVGTLLPDEEATVRFQYQRTNPPHRALGSIDSWVVCVPENRSPRILSATGMIGGLSLVADQLGAVASEISGDRLGEWALSPADKIGVSGAFNGGSAEQFAIYSEWGLGILGRSATGRLRSVTMAQHGTSAGSWQFKPGQSVVGSGDFDGDGRDELVLRNDQGIGILRRSNNGTLTQLNWGRYDSWLGGWYLQRNHRIAGIADFDGDGRDELLVQSHWGIGLLGRDGHGWLVSSFMAQNGRRLGEWKLGSSNRIVATGDFNADGRDDAVVQSPWGIGVLSTVGTRWWTDIGAAQVGQWRDAWEVASTDQVAGVGDWTGDGVDDLVLRGTRGVHVVDLVRAGDLWPVDTMLNGNFFGQWKLGPRDAIVGVGDFDGDGLAEIALQSAWGLGIVGQGPVYPTTKDARPYRTFLRGWLLRPTDRIHGVARLDGRRDALLIQHTIHSGWLPPPPWS